MAQPSTSADAAPPMPEPAASTFVPASAAASAAANVAEESVRHCSPPAHSSPARSPSASSPPTQSAVARFDLHARVRVWWGDEAGWVRGTVVDRSESLEDGRVLVSYRVRHGDGDTYNMADDGTWEIERLDGAGPSQASPGAAGGSCDEVVETRPDFDEIGLRCPLSGDRLLDPARGRWCRHPALFNYRELSRHVSRRKTCPSSLCDAKLVAPRHIERDEWLREQLQTLPASAGPSVWVRHNVYCGPREFRTSDPNPQRAAGGNSAPVVAIDDEDDEDHVSAPPNHITIDDDDDDEVMAVGRHPRERAAAAAEARAKRPRSGLGHDARSSVAGGGSSSQLSCAGGRDSRSSESGHATMPVGARAVGSFRTPPQAPSGRSQEEGIELSDDDEEDVIAVD